MLSAVVETKPQKAAVKDKGRSASAGAAMARERVVSFMGISPVALWFT